jgi:hypothetical protein
MDLGRGPLADLARLRDVRTRRLSSYDRTGDNALANDYSSTAYWYQLGRTEPLPPLPPVELRIPRP